MDPAGVLRGVFGYEAFRPGQERIIQSILAGRDCIGVMPTGAGKSLTFQIPARLLPGLGRSEYHQAPSCPPRACTA